MVPRPHRDVPDFSVPCPARYPMGATLSLSLLVDELVLMCLEGLHREAVLLCPTSSSCRRLRALTEQTARRRCAEIGRCRLDGRSWCQILGHMARGKGSELHLTIHTGLVWCVAVLVLPKFIRIINTVIVYKLAQMRWRVEK